MRRILKLAVVFTLILSVTGTGLYLMFKPANANVLKQTSLKASTLTFSDLETYLLEHPGIHNIYFCEVKNSDCEFVKNDLMVKLADEANVEVFADIESVDMSTLSDEISSNALRNAWGFSHYPAFVKYDSTDGIIKLVSSLEWSNDKPFLVEDIKTWMVGAGIWHSEYTN